ncbi:MAG: glycogen synthase GlgA [Nitrospirae bacterium]|nr:glycogen synthase GlgA [Nitrospirota bacterium]
MKVLIVTPEAVPFIKTGGLADVAGAIVDEYKKMEVDASIFLPLYRKIKNNAKALGIKCLDKKITIPFGDKYKKGVLWKGKTPKGATAYFIENDKFYDRDELYGTPKGDFSDNIYRFTFFCRGVLEALKVLKLNFDVIHCNDWQSGLIPVYLKTIYRDDFPETISIITIHNLGYQGLFPSSDMLVTGLGREFFNMDALEFYGKINFLKGGILFADVITTVSNNYAKEILTEEYGFGLDGVLRKRINDLYGIINGIDYNEWNTRKDSLIPAPYSIKNLAGKSTCKKALQKTCGLTQDNALLIGMVSRLSAQKGLDITAQAMDGIIKLGAQVVILGKGDEPFHRILLDLQKKYSGQLSVTIGFDNALAHKIYAGSDVFLMPSKYEPCGLGQLIALRYGTIPIARRTGGIADTITQYDPSEGTGTGFLFDKYSEDDLLRSVKKAKELFSDKKQWSRIRKNAMSEDFSWRQSARQYLSLYKKVISKRDS